MTEGLFESITTFISATWKTTPRRPGKRSVFWSGERTGEKTNFLDAVIVSATARPFAERRIPSDAAGARTNGLFLLYPEGGYGGSFKRGPFVRGVGRRWPWTGKSFRDSMK